MAMEYRSLLMETITLVNLLKESSKDTEFINGKMGACMRDSFNVVNEKEKENGNHIMEMNLMEIM